MVGNILDSNADVRQPFIQAKTINKKRSKGGSISNTKTQLNGPKRFAGCSTAESPLNLKSQAKCGDLSKKTKNTHQKKAQKSQGKSKNTLNSA